MPPVPIYTQSPINAAKADGITPQTAAAGDKAQPVPSATTTSAEQIGAYPVAQPGAVPSLPTMPTPTTTRYGQGPPPPQPGVVPVAPGTAPMTAASGPPPPQVTAPARLPGQGSALPLRHPEQMSVPAPTVPHAQRGTSVAQFSSYSNSVVDKMSHPPGYQQNINASELSSSQRAAQYGGPPPSTDWRGGNESYGDDGDEEGVWNAARKWAQAAGDKLSAAENEVWRRINRKE